MTASTLAASSQRTQEPHTADSIYNAHLGDAFRTTKVCGYRTRRMPQRQAFAQYKANLDKAVAQWQSIRNIDLTTLNSHLHTASMKVIAVPAANQLHAEAPADSDDVP